MLKRVFAIVGIIFLLSLYIITFIFALTDNPNTMNLLGASFSATIVIPVLFWVAMLFFKGRKENLENKELMNEKKNGLSH